MATTTAVSPEAPAPEPMSGWARIVGVFFSPGATFADIARKPTWVLPVVLMTIFSIGVSITINQRVNWREYMAQKIEQSPRAANMTAEQKDAQIEGGAKITPIITYCFGAIGPIIFILFFTLITWGAFNLIGGANATFGQSLAINGHTAVIELIRSVLFVAVLFLKPPGTVDLENPVAVNLAAFLPDDSAKWLIAFGKSVDILTIWGLLLLAIGFTAVSPRKLKGGKAYTVAFMIWGLFLVLRVGFAFIFS